jgi:hypothetical protein
MGPRLSLASPQVMPHTTMTQQICILIIFELIQTSLVHCAASRPRVARAWSLLAAEFSRWPTLSPTKLSARSSGTCLGPCLPLCRTAAWPAHMNHRCGIPDKHQAKVLFVSHECDLALLEPEDPSLFAGHTPLCAGTACRVMSQTFSAAQISLRWRWVTCRT